MYKTKKRKPLPIRRLKGKIKSISLIGITVLSLSVTAINSSFAATLDTNQNRDISQTANSTFNKNSSEQIQGFINDVRSFARGDFFGSITQLIKNAIGSVEIPDLGEVVSEIMKGSLPEDGVIANKLENNIPNSYAIRQDIANQSERLGAIEVAQIKTLSKNAQQQSKSTLNKSENSELESSQMSDDSQNSDTSQQILQNISKQLKSNTTIADLQLQEASQARQDRALGLTLTAQTAQELNAVNTRERQSAIATGNSAVSQSSLLVMPGGSVFSK
ncbi:hypothetical protein [Brunnivagina elsteri]|uniref:Uncharacterized protein n=1 Tax=Brunnivagina elsteri CCALA 953 TaxID=987040 RepID=A0A2A2TIT8_9CYAN|nr:hypothetical protein [Calothrix elsteri]PAX53607.1 hypothetical protein CK510_13435 [Calothrix elsteri CCALA 953]